MIIIIIVNTKFSIICMGQRGEKYIVDPFKFIWSQQMDAQDSKLARL